jgi:hypothetical protein
MALGQAPTAGREEGDASEPQVESVPARVDLQGQVSLQ